MRKLARVSRLLRGNAHLLQEIDARLLRRQCGLVATLVGPLPTKTYLRPIYDTMAVSIQGCHSLYLYLGERRELAEQVLTELSRRRTVRRSFRSRLPLALPLVRQGEIVA